jgi:hypothetical protein
LSSESRSNAVTELVKVPSIDYAESQKKYSRARIDGDAVIRLVGEAVQRFNDLTILRINKSQNIYFHFSR